MKINEIIEQLKQLCKDLGLLNHFNDWKTRELSTEMLLFLIILEQGEMLDELKFG